MSAQDRNLYAKITGNKMTGVFFFHSNDCS
jgi:hypothetical protein